jgi:hypothetical protein
MDQEVPAADRFEPGFVLDSDHALVDSPRSCRFLIDVTTG